MLIACVQTDITLGDVPANVTRVTELLESAIAKGANLIVMPECMLSGYAFDSRENAWPHALSLDDDIFQHIGQTLGKTGAYATLGFLEKDGERLFNAAAMVGPQGIVGNYRKIHLPHLGVDRFVDRGDIPYQTFSAGEIKVGLAICYDSSFPEPMRVLGLAGADVIALGTNWPSPAEHTASIVPPARSFENHLYFVAANRVGTESGFEFFGRSSICGPDGVVLAKSGDDSECILYAEIDLTLARNKRIERTKGLHAIDRFADRRPEFYRPIGEDTIPVTRDKP